MEITECRDYVNSNRVKAGISVIMPFKIVVDRCYGKDITPLMDEIERAFKVYQYKHGNGVEYGDHELFFWTNGHPNCLDEHGRMTFFSLNLNDRTTPENRKSTLERVLQIIERWDGTVVGEKIRTFSYSDGTTMELEVSKSHARIDYHDELLDAETVRKKAIENLAMIGTRRCSCGGRLGRFEVYRNKTAFRPFRSRSLYLVSDEQIAMAEVEDNKPKASVKTEDLFTQEVNA